MMPELDNERHVLGSQVRDTELQTSRTAELEALLRLVHVDVVRASGVLADLDEKIATALNWNKGAGPGPRPNPARPPKQGRIYQRHQD
jgi:hypothetical protein